TQEGVPMKKFIILIGLVCLAGAGCERKVSADNAPAATAAANPAPTPAAAPNFREVRIPAGTKLGVRLNSGVSSNGSHAEQAVDATIIAPVKIRGAQVIPAGSHVKGDVVAAQPSGRVKGRARLALRFNTLSIGGDSYPI